jgi:uncharacterized short protein YbdD (DUF466 family)
VTPGAAAHTLPRLRRFLAAAARAAHRVLGAPDYDAYLAYHARHHVGAPPLTRAEFVRRCQEDRHARPGSRCC